MLPVLQFIPSVETSEFVDPVGLEDTMQKVPFFAAMRRHKSKTGNTRCVQVIPSGDVAAIVEPLGKLSATMQNKLPFQAMLIHCWLLGKVTDDHVVPPSLDIAPMSELLVIAQNTVPFHATSTQLAVSGIVKL